MRTRPDLYFYGPLPRLSDLEADAVHTRLRCGLAAASHGRVRLNMVPSENHLDLWSSCVQAAPARKLAASRWCSCKQRQCDADSFVVDDQFGIVPRQLGAAYFNFTGTITRAIVEASGACPALWSQGFWPLCAHTASLLRQRAKVLPAELPFTIARERSGASPLARGGGAARADGDGKRLKFDTNSVNVTSGRQDSVMASADIICSGPS